MTMTDFFEVDEKQKTVKILNLDDFSVEDLQNYISELQTEIRRSRSRSASPRLQTRPAKKQKTSLIHH